MRKQIGIMLISLLLAGAQAVWAAPAQRAAVSDDRETVSAQREMSAANPGSAPEEAETGETAGIEDTEGNGQTAAAGDMTAPDLAEKSEEAAGDELLDGITKENYPRVDGSTATLPLSSAVYRLATGCSMKEADEAVVHTKTTNSYLRLINGEVDLLIVADKNETVDAAIAETGVELEIRPIALDAFIFMTNEANPVQSLTKEQIVAIYTGQITNWAQVGGEDKEIVPFQRNENAGSQTAMKSLVMQGQEMIEPEMLKIGTMEALLEAVASYNNQANALGYSYYYYASLMYQTPGLRFMAVDGVVPSNESVQDGSYPYIARYYAAVRKDEGADTPARRIFDWLTTVSGQELAADLGYIPIDASVQPETIHTNEAADQPLPIGEDERLAVMTGNHSAVIVDRYGTVTDRFENAHIGSTETEILGIMQEAKVLPAGEPIPVFMKTGEGEDDYRAGLYSLQENRWLLEPQYDGMTILSDSLCTDSSMMISGRLMTYDGTVLSDPDEYTVFYRTGDVICCWNKLYDLEGNLLSALDQYPIRIWNDRLCTVRADGATVMQDLYGNLIWAEETGLNCINIQGDYISWRDGNNAGMITDLSLNRLMDDGMFLVQNADCGASGAAMEVVSLSPDGQELLVRMNNEGGNQNYYRCDREFYVIESYGGRNVNQEWISDGEYRFWSWHAEDGSLSFEQIWGEDGAQIAYDGDPKDGIYISKCGSILQVSWPAADWNHVYLTDGESLDLEFSADGMEELEDGIVVLWCYDRETEKTKRVFYRQDGTCLAGDDMADTLYAALDFRCVRYGSYIYVEDYEGTLYVRLLADDEERPETETHLYW